MSSPTARRVKHIYIYARNSIGLCVWIIQKLETDGNILRELDVYLQTGATSTIIPQLLWPKNHVGMLGLTTLCALHDLASSLTLGKGNLASIIASM
jgi:hypothetical protein